MRKLVFLPVKRGLNPFPRINSLVALLLADYDVDSQR